MNCIIVEDDQDLCDSLILKLKHACPHVHVLDTCTNILEANKAIKTLKPDFIFLDIKLKDFTGFDLLDSFNSAPFETIIISSYDKYGVKAFKYNAIDYLLKPIAITDLIKAVDKIEQKLTLQAKVNETIALPDGHNLEFTKTNEIIFFESNANFVWVHLIDNKKVLISRSLKEIESVLIKRHFFRIHRSYLINIEHIKKFVNKKDQSYILLKNNRKLAVSENRKQDFIKSLNRLRIS